MSRSMDKQSKSTLRLSRKVKQNKLAAMYRHLNVAYDLDLVDTNQFKLSKKNNKSNKDKQQWFDFLEDRN